MGIFDGYLICSDIDGTLTDDNGNITKENLEYIRYFQENGGYFTISTGRFPDHIKKYFDVFVPNCPAIVGNGGVLYDYAKDEIVKGILFECDSEDFIQFFWQDMKNVNQIGFCDHKGAIENFIKNDTLIYDEYFMKVTTLSSYDELKSSYQVHKNNISRYYIIQDNKYITENVEILNNKFSEKYEFFASWKEGIECLPKGVKKGTMISELKALLGNIHTTICVGDFDNDISMFKVADKSFAVDNAPDRVKKHATDIAPNNNSDAIAYIIKKILGEL